ncbi:unnamed protein product, partial [Ranitomeya imitator]
MVTEPDSERSDDATEHGGRVRSFRHERGNWASYVYVAFHPREEFWELLEELKSAARKHGVTLSTMKELHVSLSHTVVLRHHWIQTARPDPPEQSLLNPTLKVYVNKEKKQVARGRQQLLEAVSEVDKSLQEFHLETFHQNPSFHVSLAWSVGDVAEALQGADRGLQQPPPRLSKQVIGTMWEQMGNITALQISVIIYSGDITALQISAVPGNCGVISKKMICTAGMSGPQGADDGERQLLQPVTPPKSSVQGECSDGLRSASLPASRQLPLRAATHVSIDLSLRPQARRCLSAAAASRSLTYKQTRDQDRSLATNRLSSSARSLPIMSSPEHG